MFLDLILIVSSMIGIFTDIHDRRLSNRLCLFILTICVMMVLYDEHLQFHILQSLSVLLVGMLLFALGVMGAGDVKLFASYALIIDKEFLPLILILIGIIGAIVAIIMLIIHVFNKDKMAVTPGVPYGIPIITSSLFGIFLSKLN